MSNHAVQQAVKIAREVLAGKLDILNGCSALSHHLVEADLWNDPDFWCIQGVHAASSHLPLAHDRALWNQEVLKRKDEEISQLIEANREAVLNVCRRIVERHG